MKTIKTFWRTKRFIFPFRFQTMESSDVAKLHSHILHFCQDNKNGFLACTTSGGHREREREREEREDNKVSRHSFSLLLSLIVSLSLLSYLSPIVFVLYRKLVRFSLSLSLSLSLPFSSSQFLVHLQTTQNEGGRKIGKLGEGEKIEATIEREREMNSRCWTLSVLTPRDR